MVDFEPRKDRYQKEKKKTEFKEEKSDEGKQIPPLGKNYYSFSPTFWRFKCSSSKDAGNFCTHSTNPSSHAASTLKVSSKNARFLMITSYVNLSTFDSPFDDFGGVTS